MVHPLWTITSDGSLRNGGVEFITTGGKGGELLYQAYERIVATLERVNYDASWRCSTHMHINMLDFTLNQVARFMMVYAACEPVLFQHCGALRRSSNFCTPLGDSLPFHKKLIARFYDDAIVGRLAAQYTVKYTAMNFQPLFGDGRGSRALGTCEFRGGRPMTTMNDFLLQTNLLLSIKEFVRTFQGTESEMLIRLNDGVMNTVYANGIATGLDVPTDQLDEALTNAWMLLKAYQYGMSKKPTKKASLSEDLDSILRSGRPQTARTVPPPSDLTRLAASEIERLGYLDSSLAAVSYDGMSVDQVGMDLTQHWPWLFNHYSLVTDRDASVNALAQQMFAGLTHREQRYATPSMQAAIATAHWVLRASGASRIERYPVGTMVRTRNATAQGRPQCVDNSKPPSRQPKFQFTSSWNCLNYRGSLDPAAIASLGVWIGSSQPIEIFNRMLGSRVRVKNREALLAASQAVGLDWTWNGRDTMQAIHLQWILRLSGRRSIDHVFRADLPLYDRMAAAAEILWSAGCGVPVYKDHTHDGIGTVRVEVSPYNMMGYGISRARAETPWGTESRISTTTGREVY